MSRGATLAAAVCLVVPAAANTLYHLITPLSASTTAGTAAQAAAHPHLAYVVFAQCLLPFVGLGVAVVAWQASAGSRRLAWIGGALLASGYLLSNLDQVQNLVLVVAAHALDPAQATRIAAAYGDSTASHIGMLALIAGQAPGLIVLGSALWRSRIVPRWVALGMIVTLPLHLLSHSTTSERLPALSWGWLTLVFAACAFWLLRAGEPSDSNDDRPKGWSSTAPDLTMAE